MRTDPRVMLAVFPLFLASIGAAADESRFTIGVEAAAVWQSKNDVQIPNDGSADRFSLRDLAGGGPWPAARIEFTWDVRPRHGLRFLAAPLSYAETGAFDAPVRFTGETFAPGEPVEATYQFDSWRATYRFRLNDGARWRWWIGGTLKVRDARIRLEQGATVGEDTDLGVVPLLYVRGDWRFAERWQLTLDLDGLAGGPGRAIDLSVQASRAIGDRWRIGAGYRTVEGGVDIDDVYNFAWFHYAVVSGAVRF